MEKEKMDYSVWGMRELIEELEKRDRDAEGTFPITSVSREDLESIDYDASKVDDADMRQLASKMADAYCDSGFWIDLPIIADYLKIPKRKE